MIICQCIFSLYCFKLATAPITALTYYHKQPSHIIRPFSWNVLSNFFSILRQLRNNHYFDVLIELRHVLLQGGQLFSSPQGDLLSSKVSLNGSFIYVIIIFRVFKLISFNANQTWHKAGKQIDYNRLGAPSCLPIPIRSNISCKYMVLFVPNTTHQSTENMAQHFKYFFSDVPLDNSNFSFLPCTSEMLESNYCTNKLYRTGCFSKLCSTNKFRAFQQCK